MPAFAALKIIRVVSSTPSCLTTLDFFTATSMKIIKNQYCWFMYAKTSPDSVVINYRRLSNKM